MSLANRLTLLTGGVIGSTVLLAAWSFSCPPDASIWLLDGNEFTRRELAAFASAFAKSQLDEYEIVDGRVRIPRPRRSAYVKSLVDHQALPARLHASPRDLPINPFESLQQQKLRSRHELQQQLAECICAMEGIEDATVHLDEAITGKGFQREHRVTAAVTICPQPDTVISPTLMRSIGKLVAGAKAELTAENVTVTDLSSGIALRGGMPAEQDRHDEMRLWKRHFEQQILQRLQPLQQRLPSSRWAVDLTMKWHTAPWEGGVPDTTSAAAPQLTRCLPTSIAISAEIPADYYLGAWRERAEGATDGADTPNAKQLAALEQETRGQLETWIAARLPRWSAEAPAWNLQLSTLPTAGPASRRERPLASFWTIRRTTAAVAGFSLACAACGLAIARGRRSPCAGPAATTSRPELKVVTSDDEEPRRHTGQPGLAATSPPRRHSAEAADGSPHPPEAPLRSRATTTVHTELTQLVRENPKRAAEMLQQWAGKAG